MPIRINRNSVVSEAINRRFFQAIEVLISQREFRSLEAFCTMHRLSPPRYRALRLQFGTTPKPGYVSAYTKVEIEAIHAMVMNYRISAKWLITGYGEMLTAKQEPPKNEA